MSNTSKSINNTNNNNKKLHKNNNNNNDNNKKVIMKIKIVAKIIQPMSIAIITTMTIK